MKPPCYNRPPFAEGRWHYTGEWRRGKPVMRWHPRWFADRCATHDGVGIGPNNEGYPAAHGWDCSGCRLDPRSLTSNLAMFAERLEYAVRGAYDIDAFEPIQRSKQP